jgi:glutamyl-tRNA synthetase
VESLQLELKQLFLEQGVIITDHAKFEKVLELVKDRCILLTDFVQQASFFFKPPESIDTGAIQPKWNESKQLFFSQLIRQLELIPQWEASVLENEFKEIAAAMQIKPGDVLLPLRVMLVGGKFGPGVFDIAALLDREETLHRIRHALKLLAS